MNVPLASWLDLLAPLGSFLCHCCWDGGLLCGGLVWNFQSLMRAQNHHPPPNHVPLGCDVRTSGVFRVSRSSTKGDQLSAPNRAIWCDCDLRFESRIAKSLAIRRTWGRNGPAPSSRAPPGNGSRWEVVCALCGNICVSVCMLCAML